MTWLHSTAGLEGTTTLFLHIKKGDLKEWRKGTEILLLLLWIDHFKGLLVDHFKGL